MEENYMSILYMLPYKYLPRKKKYASNISIIIQKLSVMKERDIYVTNIYNLLSAVSRISYVKGICIRRYRNK